MPSAGWWCQRCAKTALCRLAAPAAAACSSSETQCGRRRTWRAARRHRSFLQDQTQHIFLLAMRYVWQRAFASGLMQPPANRKAQRVRFLCQMQTEARVTGSMHNVPEGMAKVATGTPSCAAAASAFVLPPAGTTSSLEEASSR